MTFRYVEANGRLYRFCPDDRPRAADRLRAVVRWVVHDEITQEAPEVEFTLRSAQATLQPRVGHGGVMGLVGNPGRLFPGLSAATVSLQFSIAAHGYLPRRMEATLGPIAGFPDDFAPADLGSIPLHRDAVVLRGRVVQRTGLDPTPLPGVSVALAGVWSTFPPHDVDPSTVMEPPNVVSLSPGLYAERFQPGDGLRRRDMVLSVGQEKRLLAPTVLGDTTVRLNDRLNLNPGDVLAFEAGVPNRAEYVLVAAVHPASTDDQPAYVSLHHPLALEHEEGAVCVRATPQMPGANNALQRDGIPRERVAFLASLSGLASGAIVEISGGVVPAEYHTAMLHQTVSDADGFFRLPPLSRVASVMLQASHINLPVPQRPVFSPNYDRYENQLDVVFP